VRLLVLLLLLPGALFAQKLPVIKAKVGHPVLQELMGGCSLRCAFGWTTQALLPGGALQPVYTLDDSYAASAWIDPNPGVGTKLVLQFPKKLPAEFYNNIPFYGFDMANGRIVPIEEFKSYARVKKMRMSYNGKPLYDIVFADTYRWQNVAFDDIPANQGDIVTLEILETYPGTRSPHVAITELILQGAH
jgi:hypothetical protein